MQILTDRYSADIDDFTTYSHNNIHLLKVAAEVKAAQELVGSKLVQVKVCFNLAFSVVHNKLITGSAFCLLYIQGLVRDPCH